jgi:hypothetical protein
VHELRLRGRFEPEGVSPDGRLLFLVHFFPSRGDPRYAVRAYDLAAKHLLGSAEVADGGRMQGFAWGAVASPDGRWLHTLYLDTAHERAFVHALDVRNGHAACIDLPSGRGDPLVLGGYTLVPAPDGRRVYAANPQLGVVAEVDLVRTRLARVTRFAPSRPPGPASAGAVTRDGGTIAFAGKRRVWTYDTRAGRVAGPFPTYKGVLGVAFDPAAPRLLVVRYDRSVVARNLR